MLLSGNIGEALRPQPVRKRMWRAHSRRGAAAACRVLQGGRKAVPRRPPCNVLGNVYFIALGMMRKHNLENSLDKDEKNQLRQVVGHNHASAGCGSKLPGSGPGLGRTGPVVGTGEPRKGGS